MNPPSILLHIAQFAPKKFLELLEESERRLIASWEAAVEEAAIHEAKPKLKVTLSVVVDLDEDSIEYEIAFGGRHKLSVSEALQDPRQLGLPITDDPPGIKRKRARAK